MDKQLPPVVAIVGPTAAGKSRISIELAEEFHGEIISADSRQVYRHMNIGTAKIHPEQQQRVPHHLLDVAEPTETYTLAQFQKAAFTTIDHIHARGRLPFLVGGTGLYVQSVIDNLEIPAIPPQEKLREELGTLSLPQLRERLKAGDPVGYLNIDLNNPRRIIRAIEVTETAGVPFSKIKKAGKPKYDPLLLGITKTKDSLDKRIADRMKERMEAGMCEEVQALHDEHGVTWDQLEAFGLEYRRIAQYLQGAFSYDEMVEKLTRDITNFAKRQMTWFKRDKRIHWVENENEAESVLSDWLVNRAARTVDG